MYARYMLSSADAASPAKEIGFVPADYQALKGGPTGGWKTEQMSKAGKKRIKDFQNATELSANVRRPVTLLFTSGEEGAAREAQIKTPQVQGQGQVQARDKDGDKDKGKGKRKWSSGKGRYEKVRDEREEVVKVDEGVAEALMRAVGKVERNFWVFVADEMERETGRYCDPRELERVFHEI